MAKERRSSPRSSTTAFATARHLGIDATVRFITATGHAPSRAVRACRALALQHASERRTAAGSDRQPGPRVDRGGARPADTDYLYYVVGRLLRQALVLQDRRRVPALRRRVQPRPRGARRLVADRGADRRLRLSCRPQPLAGDDERRLAELGLDWRYFQLPVPPERFTATAAALSGSGYRGANVTIPHKLAAHDLAGELSSRRRRSGRSTP